MSGADKLPSGREVVAALAQGNIQMPSSSGGVISWDENGDRKTTNATVVFSLILCCNGADNNKLPQERVGTWTEGHGIEYLDEKLLVSYFALYLLLDGLTPSDVLRQQHPTSDLLSSAPAKHPAWR